MAEDKDLQLTQKEITSLDAVAKDVVAYSEDDRRKADDLYRYYQELIEKGDTKGDTRVALAKSLELREQSVGNLIEILKLKTRLIEKKIGLEMRRQMADGPGDGIYHKRSGFDSSDVIRRMDEDEEEEKEE